MTNTLTEADDLKRIWQQLDRRLARHEAVLVDGERHRRIDALRARLRPLRWGQQLQIPFGGVVVLLAVASWWSRWDMAAVRASAFVVQLYGIALIAAGGQTLLLLGRVDYAAPVVTIQRRLAEVQWWYSMSGLVLGMAWWLLWMPAVLMLAGLFRIDLVARAPWVLLGYVGSCLVGLGLSLWALRWAERSTRPAIRAWAERTAAGASLCQARQALDEIQRFETEGE